MFLLPNDAWEVRKTSKMGKGIFAKKAIAPGLVIGDYVGKVMRPGDIDEDKDGLYEMYFSSRASIFPDLKKPGIHLLNHSCMPNCWFYTYKGHTIYFTLRQIFPGEELTISYLLGLKEDCDKDCEHACLCGTKVCSGSMHTPKKQHAAWTKHEAKLTKKTKRVKVKIGEMLPPLGEYPEEIPDAAVYELFGSQKKRPEQLPSTKMPSVEEIRKRIRTSGRFIKLPKLGKTVLGISENKIVTA